MTPPAGREVVIIGGGVMGSSIAWHLAPQLERVLVIERDPTYARASSALSASSIRQQFSTPLNIHLSRYGIGFLRKARELLDVDLGLKEPGYLFLASPAGAAVLRANHAIQKAEGCAVELLAPAALTRRFAALSAEGIVLASHGTANEGWFDGPALMQAFRRKARERGAEYLHDEVVGLAPHSVTLRSGRTIEARTIVVAAGPWSGEVAALAGIALPVEPRRRSVFVFDCRAALPPLPLTIDPSGVWFRPEGRFYLAATVGNAWAGYYEYNTFDQNGIVGRHPEIDSIVFATGFSGHGIQQSPAVGRAVAELILHGDYRTLNLSPFGYERISAGRPVRELNVV